MQIRNKMSSVKSINYSQKLFKAICVFSLTQLLMSCKIDKNEKPGDPNAGPIDTSSVSGKYALSEAFPELQFKLPLELTSPNDGTDRVFVVEQEGKIKVFPAKASVTKSTVFLDITNRITSGGEKGLLGLAFHPDYKTNGYFYINCTKANPLRTVIARYKVNSANPDIADPASEQALLTYEQPYVNHNGGKLAFGNDGFLYIAAGDGGSGGDPGNRAQNRKELLGKILRIDVNHQTGNLKYSIPADNPYAKNNQGYRRKFMLMACVIRGVLAFTTNLVLFGLVTWDKIKLRK